MYLKWIIIQQTPLNWRGILAVDPWNRKNIIWCLRQNQNSVMFEKISYPLDWFAGLVRNITPTQICKLPCPWSEEFLLWDSLRVYVFFHTHYMFFSYQPRMKKGISNSLKWGPVSRLRVRCCCLTLVMRKWQESDC